MKAGVRLHGARSSGLVRSKAECTSEEADLAVRTLLDILLQSHACQASQVKSNLRSMAPVSSSCCVPCNRFASNNG